MPPSQPACTIPSKVMSARLTHDNNVLSSIDKIIKMNNICERARFIQQCIRHFKNKDRKCKYLGLIKSTKCFLCVDRISWYKAINRPQIIFETIILNYPLYMRLHTRTLMVELRLLFRRARSQLIIIVPSAIYKLSS